MPYVKSDEACKILGIHHQTLHRWAKKGKINYILTGGGHRRYNADDYINQKSTGTSSPKPFQRFKTGFECEGPTRKETKGAIYARVSSTKQKDDLERQINSLKSKYPNHTVYKDIASGLKYKRSGLERLLEHVQAGMVSEVVVAHRDRLARFGTEIIEWVIRKAGASIIIDDDNSRFKSKQEELVADLMAIVHVFSCRQNGMRRYKKAIESATEGESTGIQRQNKRRKKTIESEIRFEPNKRQKCQSLQVGEIVPNTETAPIVNEML